MSRKNKKRQNREHNKDLKKLDSVHHIFPKHRFPEYEGSEWNQKIVNQFAHNHYHALFGEKTPMEILKFLNDYFWKGHTTIPFKGGLSDGTAQG